MARTTTPTRSRTPNASAPSSGGKFLQTKGTKTTPGVAKGTVKTPRQSTSRSQQNVDRAGIKAKMKGLLSLHNSTGSLQTEDLNSPGSVLGQGSPFHSSEPNKLTYSEPGENDLLSVSGHEPEPLSTIKTAKHVFASGSVKIKLEIREDHVIIWSIVGSVAVVKTLDHWSSVYSTNFPFSLLFAWMLVAFAAGTAVNVDVLIEKVKSNLLGLTEPDKGGEHVDMIPLVRHVSFAPQESPGIDGDGEGIGNGAREGGVPGLGFVRNVFRREVQRKSMTVLRGRNKETHKQKKNIFSIKIMKKLQKRFASGKTLEKSPKQELQMAPSVLPERTNTPRPVTNRHIQEVENNDSTDTTTSNEYSMGGCDPTGTRADTLMQKLSIDPVFQLRGMDVFMTDCAEHDMATHPFLLKSGLREVPTFMVNIITQWGTTLVYFKMPNWVADFGPSLEEKDDDPEPVKALKRFLSGDDEYRKARFRLMAELVEAPYALRLMATTGSDFPLHMPGLLETSYHLHDKNATTTTISTTTTAATTTPTTTMNDDVHVYSDKSASPILEVTIDFASNATTRGMASLGKRYLPKTSVDIAFLIGKPEGQEENEPEACLGLYRMDHIDFSTYTEMPDRYTADGCSNEKSYRRRASLLAETAKLQSTRCLASSLI